MTIQEVVKARITLAHVCECGDPVYEHASEERDEKHRVVIRGGCQVCSCKKEWWDGR